MTEPIAVDAPARTAGTRPAPLSTAPKPADKAKPGDAPPGAAPPPPGGKSLLARLTAFAAARTTKKQLAVGASAVFSLAAGIAAVRLMWPGDDKTPSATATQPLAADPKPQP